MILARTYWPLLLGATILLGLAPARTSLAQTPDQTPSASPLSTSSLSADENSNIYTADYFTVFNPRTALDMISQIPGFSLRGGNDGERGFGQADTNLLINGNRPSTKSSGANQLLRRIPADSVIRIEILDGASLDIPGLSGQVANIVSNSSKLTGNWEYAARFEEGTEPQLQEAKLSISGSSGNLAYIIGLRSDQFTFTEEGSEQFRNADGTVYEERIEDIDFDISDPEIDINLTWTPENGHVANLNLLGEIQNENFRAVEFFEAVRPGGNTGQSIFDSGEEQTSIEIGGDYAFDLGPGNLKLIGLYSYEDESEVNVFQNYVVSQPDSLSLISENGIQKEYIGRGEYSWKRGKKHDWQVALEVAFNSLDNEFEFRGTGQAVNFDTTRVEELRTQGSLTHGWAVSDKLNLQTSLGAEYSEISVPGSGQEPRTFVRPKGFLTASYTINPTYALRAKVERSVGQLNFGTFVSSVNLTDNTQNGGNIDIVPTQFWNGELEIERTDDKILSGKITAGIQFVEDAIEQIPLGNGAEGPGNLDGGFEWNLNANATWLLDHIGLKGMRIEANGGYQDTRIDDPVTGLSRRFNASSIWSYFAKIQHDIPNTPYAWEVSIEDRDVSKFFRLDQSFGRTFDKPFMAVFLTHKDLFGLNLRVGLQNGLDRAFSRERVIFAPNRTGVVTDIETFRRKRGRRISLIISDTF